MENGLFIAHAETICSPRIFHAPTILIGLTNMRLVNSIVENFGYSLVYLAVSCPPSHMVLRLLCRMINFIAIEVNHNYVTVSSHNIKLKCCFKRDIAMVINRIARELRRDLSRMATRAIDAEHSSSINN